MNFFKTPIGIDFRIRVQIKKNSVLSSPKSKYCPNVCVAVRVEKRKERSMHLMSRLVRGRCETQFVKWA